METMQKKKVSVSWSGGKDSAYALWVLLNDKEYEVVSLHTTFGEQTKRVGMHGIREGLVEAQALSIGLPLEKIYYPASGNNAAYEKVMGSYLAKLEEKGVKHVAFGDILLEDLKKYRESSLAKKGFTAVFPLWKRNTKAFSEELINRGFKTKICAADMDYIPDTWIGEDYSMEFIGQLPPNVDPCGENGEFHSFCYDGPVFTAPVNILCKEVALQSYELKKADGSMEKKHFRFAELDYALGNPTSRV